MAATASQSEASKREVPSLVAPSSTQTLEPVKSASVSQMLAASFSASSSLSQLAELAVGKAQQNQGLISSVVTGGTQASTNHNRLIIPGHNLPLPSGGQQPIQIPLGFGSYQPGSLIQMQSGQFHGSTQTVQIPPPFLKGSIIQLASGELKRVEDLTTEDFIQSTKLCPDLNLETSTIILIQESADTATANVSFTINSTKAQVSQCTPQKNAIPAISKETVEHAVLSNLKLVS